MNGNFYGNPVFFMPYHDLYYSPPPTHGSSIDSETAAAAAGLVAAAPYQPFSPPLEISDIASPQPLVST